ncbi:peptidylprolyl isomerase [Streptomyces smyrnaeus]|uniref:peptidylprolyl isomerase n=1 Tax=Streptomyces TaxID=1883 RepID=UPI000C1932F7|nr:MULTISPECIES: peptidylprolyl isomerase [unclassified Streptomyces]MBQ0865594.1 peptidylprolyl isomerase [Streptomyces sp. RK75]MBQ1122422.1 peptidylprolyl isomerase [Streptomyces sp. B15]MBQ1161484.1 peptidylprolyl isomerase [Streptomyces sp. A73]
MVSSEQRRKQLARQKYERQLKRREAARRKARIRNVSIALGLVMVLAMGGAYAASGGLNGDEKDDAAADQPSAPPTSKAPDPCEKPAKGRPTGKQWKKEPPMKVDKSASYTMRLETTCGGIDIDMDAGEAPHTVNSFHFLAGQKFFDHTRCHRMTDQPQLHVLQCGDPTGTGSGGPGYELSDENLKGAEYPAGTVAMANSGPDTAGSQFFLVYEDSKLPPKYTPFGKVSDSGMKVLKKIAKAGVASPQGDGPPNATVVIDRATVRKS